MEVAKHSAWTIGEIQQEPDEGKADVKPEDQPRITRITPNGRVKNPLMRPFGVIRVIRGWSLCLSIRHVDDVFVVVDPAVAESLHQGRDRTKQRDRNKAETPRWTQKAGAVEDRANELAVGIVWKDGHIDEELSPGTGILEQVTLDIGQVERRHGRVMGVKVSANLANCPGTGKISDDRYQEIVLLESFQNSKSFVARQVTLMLTLPIGLYHQISIGRHAAAESTTDSVIQRRPGVEESLVDVLDAILIIG